MPRLRFVLGDQLSRRLSSLSDLEAGDVVLMAEVADETAYVHHHQRKIAFLFSAMRHFAADMRKAGITVDYVRLDDPANTGSLSGELQRALERHQVSQVVVTQAGEWRVQQMLEGWQDAFDVSVEIRPDTRFLCNADTFAAMTVDSQPLVMEDFYRRMRRRTGFLMRANGTPEGGRWNFDHENRKTLPKDVAPPERPFYEPDRITEEVLALVSRRFGNHFGSLEDFGYPVTRRQAHGYLRWFVAKALPFFGDYQDAMRENAPLLFHSHLSALINCGLLDPAECCEAAEHAYREGHAPLNAAEGFIRQIIGWREFVRGIYWREMPGYGDKNALDARRPLPDFFWSGETDLNCLRQCIDDTRRNAYAHHIQRLMVIGNFCLLGGFSPREVQEWFLVVYHDAYEWVEMPNVVGMILYADDGLFATKPYVASGNYINRMSDYCRNCRYDVKKRSGPDACPFNALYWDFIARHASRFETNPRMLQTLSTLAKMDTEKVDAMRKDAQRFLDELPPSKRY